MPPLYNLPPLILQTLIWIPTRIVLKYMYHLEIRGLEHIKNLNRGVVFAANHTSELDAILIPACLPFLSKHMPMFYTCREKSFYKDKRFGWKKHIYGGIFFNVWGAFEVAVGKKDYTQALAQHEHILKDGHSVCIFPEAKKNPEEFDLRAKGGVAYLAFAAHVPIVPVKIEGAVKKDKIVVSFGKPLYEKDLFPNPNAPTISESKNDFKDAAALVMKKIREV